MENRHALQTPLWFRNGAIYQINPRTFSAGVSVSFDNELTFMGYGYILAKHQV